MQISTVLKIQGVHIQHYIFFYFCSTWILESAGWCELEYLECMDVLARRAATSSCTEALIREKCWQVSFQNFASVYSHYPPWDCFGQNALVHHIFLQSPMTAQDLRLWKMNSTQITVTDIDRPWLTRTDDRSFFPLDHGSLASSSGCYPQAAEQRATEKHWLWLIEHRHRHAQT